jgi:Ca2+-binding EF-hand superfamily protein
VHRLVALSVTLGLCAAATRAASEPRSPSHSSRHAKKAPIKGERFAEPTVANYARLVASADTDADGEVSDAELTTLVREHVEKQLHARFSRLDRNRDGRVTRSEVPSMASARFARFDVNGDGAFTARELGLVLQAQAVESCRSLIVRLDTDRDGKLSVSDVESATRLTKNDASEPSKAR